MRRVLTVVALLGLGALVMGARPGTEQQLIQQLNGQQTRWIMVDGGPSGVFTQFDGGVLNSYGCMFVNSGTTEGGVPIVPNVLVFVPLQPVNECMRPSVFAPLWDGGCNAAPRDMNYGVPLPVNVPQYLTPDSNTRSLCFVSDAGFLAVPVFFAQ